jgi:hypothetical protein
LGEEGVVRGAEDLWEAPRLDHTDTVWDAKGQAFVDGGELGLPSAG